MKKKKKKFFSILKYFTKKKSIILPNLLAEIYVCMFDRKPAHSWSIKKIYKFK